MGSGSRCKLGKGGGGGGGGGGGVTNTDAMFTGDGDVTERDRFEPKDGTDVTGKENGVFDGIASGVFTAVVG